MRGNNLLWNKINLKTISEKKKKVSKQQMKSFKEKKYTMPALLNF